MRKNYVSKENKDAKEFHGRKTINSGRHEFDKGDGENEMFVWDSKVTEKNSFKLSKQIWKKIEDEALLKNKRPMLSLDISGTELVVLDKHDFIELFVKNYP